MSTDRTTDSTRRNFLCTAPLAAAAGLGLAQQPAFAKSAFPAMAAPEPFQFFTAQDLAGDAKVLQATPGNNNLVMLKQVAVVMTTETAKSGKEFEWHEGRDHVLQIVEGETVYEVGGTPKGTHSNGGKPGEFNAPESEGAKRLTLKKGDMLTIPRGTPHKRSTATSVTFILISPQGT